MQRGVSRQEGGFSLGNFLSLSGISTLPFFAEKMPLPFLQRPIGCGDLLFPGEIIIVRMAALS